LLSLLLILYNKKQSYEDVLLASLHANIIGNLILVALFCSILYTWVNSSFSEAKIYSLMT